MNEELNFEFYLILIDLDLNSHTSLVVLVLDNVSLGERAKRTVGYSSNSREKLEVSEVSETTWIGHPNESQGSHCHAPDKAGIPFILFTNMFSALRQCLVHSSCSIKHVNE